MGQQTCNRKVKVVEKQIESEKEKTEEKDRREERITSSEGSGTLRKWWQTGRQEQRTDKKGMWRQQRGEFVDQAVFQQTDSRALSWQGGKCPRSKVIDCMWNARKEIQNGRDRCYYNLRTRPIF